VTAYRDSQEHLADELERLSLLLRAAVLELRRAPLPVRETSALAILDEEIDWQLSRPLRREAPGPERQALFAAADRHAATIAGRVADSEREGAAPRLATLARRFALTRAELDVLVLALAPELDPRFERIVGYLHDDMTRRRVSVGLALQVLARDDAGAVVLRRALMGAGSVLREGLLRAEGEPGATSLALALAVPGRIVEFLHASDEIDPALRGLARRAGAALRLPELVLAEPLRARLVTLARRWRAGEADAVYLHGSEGCGRTAAIEAVGAELGLGVLRVACAALDPGQFLAQLDRVRREALLGELVVVWEEFDGLAEARRVQVLERMAAAPTVRAAYTGTSAWEPASAGITALRIDRPGLGERRRLWRGALARHGAELDDAALAEVVGLYGFAGGPIHELVASALRHRGEGGRLSREELGAAVRRRSSRSLGSLARPLPVTRDWDDLVLAPERKQILAELCRHAQHRELVLAGWGFRGGLAGGRGLTALFTGGSGTGKTLAAGLVAGQLGLDGYQIDLASVVSKYIGETEKQLARLFDEAEAASALLFFDEADALFGKRTEVRDAHDRHANIETSYLLQRLDSYDGVVLMASNFRKNMDEAFLRRLQFIVDFPVPEAPERLQIWRRVLPPELPRAPDLDLEALALRFVLPGGNIRNIAVAAAFLAAEDGGPLAMRHLVAAARREFQKLGKVVEAGHFAGLGGA
jgi:hypothetical protein